MIKHHWFSNIQTKRYVPTYVEGDFHIFIIQHEDKYEHKGELFRHPEDQTDFWNSWIVQQPLSLVWQSPQKIVNYRSQSKGARLMMYIYKVDFTKGVQE